MGLLYSHLYAIHHDDALYKDDYCMSMAVVNEIYTLALDHKKIKIARADIFDCLHQTKQGVYLELLEHRDNFNLTLCTPFGFITFIHKIIYEPDDIQAYRTLKDKIADLKVLQYVSKQKRGCILNPDTGQYDPQEPECSLYEVKNINSKTLITKPKFVVKKDNAEYKQEYAQLLRDFVDRYDGEYFRR